MRAIIGLGACLLLMGAGCSSSQPLPAPTDLAVTQDPASFDIALLSWKAPPTPVDSYELQLLAPGHEWQSAPQAVLGSVTGGALHFATSTPEALRLLFRLRARRSPEVSGWSNESAYQRGVRPASKVQVLGLNLGLPFLVRWTQGSTQAAELRIERQVLSIDGSATQWKQLAGLAATSTSYVDPDLAPWVDGAQLSYRVIYRLDGLDSAPAAGTGDRAPPLAPTDIAAAPAGPTGIRLSWTSRSRYADRQVVLRATGISGTEWEVATLSRDASTYLDAVPATGAYRYRLSARLGPYDNIVNFVANTASVVGFTDLPDGSPLRVSGLRMPAASQAGRSGSGAFALAGRVPYTDPTGTLDVFVPQGAGWVAHAVAGNEDVLASGVVYAGDTLHVLHNPYLSSAAPSTADERFDGQWHTDDTGAPLSDVAVDSAGALHACSANGWLRYSTNRSGVWTHETVFSDDFALRCAIAVGPQGDPRIVYAKQHTPDTQNAGLLLVTHADSGWVREQVPLGTDVVSTFSSTALLRVFGPTAAKTTLLYQQFNTILDLPVRVVEREGPSWGAPVTVTPPGVSLATGAAASPDGTRLAVAYVGVGQYGDPRVLALRDAAGVWTQVTLFPRQHRPALGFTPAGKVWLLDGLGQPTADRTDYLLFQEE